MLGRSIFRVSWEMGEEVVGELEVGKFRQVEQATRDIGELVVGDIHISEAAMSTCMAVIHTCM